MKNILLVLSLLAFQHFSAPAQIVNACKKCIVLAEQAGYRVAIADVPSQKIIWEWSPRKSNIKPEHVKWFSNISDAKPVYGTKYILVTASGGGVALVRVADKKAVFYAYAGGNTHSAEVLPDGNIVSASSNGNYLCLFHVDTTSFPDKVYSKHIHAKFGHNVVWDSKRQLLWTASMNQIKAFKYNFNCTTPDLKLVDSLKLQGTESHELFPVYHENELWLTDTGAVYRFNPVTRIITKTNFSQRNIKSVSSGPQGFPIIEIKPTEQWWTDAVTDTENHIIFQQKGLKIYKARWFLPNAFSYPVDDQFRICR